MPSTVDPSALASQRCAPADATTEPLSGDELHRLATGLDPGWEVRPDRIVRTFGFPTFGAAFALATRIALLAESQGHHPTMEVTWGRLDVTWQTDAIGAVSINDLIMAAKVDRIVARGLGLKES